MRLLLLLIFPAITFAQKNCAGFIVDSITNEAIPYATIALIKENKGVSANEQGAFSINASFLNEDSFRISSVGYQTRVIAVSGWVNGSVVTLQPRAGVLREVIISGNKLKQVYTVNPFKNCSSNWYYIGMETIYQLAQQFTAPQQKMQLSELELCKDASDCIFRIRIYDIDSSCKCPSRDLTDTVIEIRSKESHVRIGLEKYDIIIPGKNFFVAIEWLFIPFNEQRETNKKNKKEIVRTFYRPGLRYVSNRDSEFRNVWELNFNGKWSEIYRTQNGFNFQITAKLK